jgi:hypothetical protein
MVEGAADVRGSIVTFKVTADPATAPAVIAEAPGHDAERAWSGSDAQT